MENVNEVRYFASHDGTRLAYLDEGAGPAVVLLHGLMANGYANWVEPGVVAAVVGAGYRSIALDARGHGQSDAPEGRDRYRPEVVADDVAALARELEIEPVSMIGYSYGSVTTALLAAAGELKLQSAALCGVAKSTLTAIVPGPATDATLAAMRVEDPATMGEQVVAMRDRMAGWNARPLAIAAMYEGLQDLEPMDLAAITIPTWVINHAMPPGEVAPDIPGARTVLVGGDHLTAPYDPAFTENILAFLQETNPV